MGDREGLTRRQLVRAGAGAGLALAAAGWFLRPDSGARAASGRALVVGAGLAGLTAAYELERLGWDVSVLEARDRLGGRVWTTRGWAGGQHAEAGGEFIDTRHTAVRDYARRFGIGLEDVRRGWAGLDDVVFRRGRRQGAGRFRAQGERTSTQTDVFWSRLYELVGRISLANPTANGGGRLDRASVADFLDELGIAGHARFLLDAELRDDYGVEPGRLSLLSVVLAERAAWEQPDAGVEAFRMRGGNSRLVAALASGISGTIETGARVSRIERGASGVSARTADGRSFAAEHCVLAAPLPALRGISFQPALPDATARAIAELGYAQVTKVMVQYRSRFWRRRGFSGDAVTDRGAGTVWEATGRQRGRPGILIAYSGGRRGLRNASLAPSRRHLLAAAEIERVWGGSERLAVEARSAAWPADPLAGGTWLTFAPGQVARHWGATRGSMGRLHLAGEHTEDLMGYMDSAIRSGRAAARRVDSA